MNPKAKVPARGAKTKIRKATAKRSAPKPAARPAARKPTAPPRAKKPAATKASAGRRKPAAAAGEAPRTLEEFMAQALAMENEAAERYAELADAMEMHNNREVAALFRKMAEIEGKHAKQIMAEMGWTSAPALAGGTGSWGGYEAPETAAPDEVHYLMQPYHALEVALAAEQRAERFFARLVRAARTESVRKAARELHDEEREHVRLVREWMQKVPKPAADWAVDPDPPVYTD